MIYLDHAATTPLDPRVLDAMSPWLTEHFGNASSLHLAGRRARAAVEDAREVVAAWIGARPAEIVFTSGGTESDNLAVMGLAEARVERGRHILTTPIEHHAVLHATARLARLGFEIEHLPVDHEGRVSADEVAARLRADTILVSVMHANNEIGTIEPVSAIGAVCAERGVPFHTDAVQSLGEERIDVRSAGVGLLAASAHKIHGPKGVGFAYVRSGLRPVPRMIGGSQERSRRAGTENVPGIVGLAAAITLLGQELAQRTAHCRRLRDRLMTGLLAIEGCALNGPREGRLANNVNVSFTEVSGENLLVLLDSQGIAVSTGSACASGATDPSHVLLALSGGDRDRDRAHGALRLTVGKDNTESEIEQTIDAVKRAVTQLRAMSPERARPLVESP